MLETGVGQLLKTGLLLKAVHDRKESNKAILKFLRFSLKLKFVKSQGSVAVKTWALYSSLGKLEISADKPVTLKTRALHHFGMESCPASAGQQSA